MSPQQDISSPGTSESFFLIEDISITDVKEVDDVKLFIGEKLIDTKWEKSDKSYRTSLDPSKHNFMISHFTLRFRGRRKMKVVGKRTIIDDIHIKLQQHFSGVDPTEKSQSVSRKYDDLTITISFASDLRKTLEESPSSSTSLQPTTTAISQICPRFRILVIGNTGVGKSTLINKVFGIELAAESHMWAGKADIGYGHCPEKNSRLILHDSRGFEPGENVSFDTVRNFINSRSKEVILGDRLHAVWLCLRIPPTGGSFFEAGIEDFLEQKKNGNLGTVPIIAVFTKYDNMITQKEYEIAHRPDWTERSKTISINKAAVEEAKKELEARCVKPFRDRAGDNTPLVVVSKGNQESIEKLVKLTVEHVEKFVSTETYIVSTMAQQASPEVKIDGSIEVGKKKYWNGLASGTNFPGKNLKTCLEVIHIDIISVWNFRDPHRHLRSKEFRDMMYNLVTNVFETRNALAPMKTLSVGLSMVGSIAGLVSALSGPAAPIVIPIAATTVLAMWLYEVYKQTDATISRFMAYIVDLTLVMQNLFWIVENVDGARPINRRMIKLALESYRQSIAKDDVHCKISDFVRGAGPVARANRDNVFDKIVELIKENRISLPEMKSHIGDLGLQNIDLGIDEPWDSTSRNR